MSELKSNDPLHGVTLVMIMDHLAATFSWQELALIVPINCFKSNPSIKSSLNFLRKTPWARTEIEHLYLRSIEEGFRKELIIPRVLATPKGLQKPKKNPLRGFGRMA
jgi:uncharacterized protein (DUF2132 family)